MKNIALITGASSGIGRELARIHAARGGDLILVARSKEKLVALKKELEEKHSVHAMVLVRDLTDPSAPAELYRAVSDAGIQIDYLINNAGFGGLGKFHERTWEDDCAMIAVNITALTHLTRLFLPDFVARNSGRILNVSSTAALLPGPLQAVYYATKAYVASLSNAIAEELHDTNVTVTNLMPGATDTGFGKRSGMDKTALFQKTASARRVAEDGYRAMLKGQRDIISGLSLPQKLLMNILPLFPKKMVVKRVRRMQKRV